MAHLLFRLRGVPDDEANEIRDLLNSHHIDFYETGAGNWGISMPALWLAEDTRLADAKDLLENYQQQRAIEAREIWNQNQRSGSNPTIFDRFKARPFAFLGLLLFCCVILYFSIEPFMRILRPAS